MLIPSFHITLCVRARLCVCVLDTSAFWNTWLLLEENWYSKSNLQTIQFGFIIYWKLDIGQNIKHTFQPTASISILCDFCLSVSRRHKISFVSLLFFMLYNLLSLRTAINLFCGQNLGLYNFSEFNFPFPNLNTNNLSSLSRKDQFFNICIVDHWLIVIRYSYWFNINQF